MEHIKLMYITNRPDVAAVVENAGVDRIFVDMEYIGKGLRQGGMDTVQSHHTVEDVKNMRAAITKAELLVRCNPIHEKTADYTSSEEEIDAVVKAGADIVMLPYFKSADEVASFIKYVGGRAKTMLLFETKESIENIDQILSLDGIDEVFIGLNDLSLSYGKKFMFEILANGTVECICAKFKLKKMQFGFGGIAAIGKGMLPSEHVIREHYRLGSTAVILSRSFCNVDKGLSIEEIKQTFDTGIKEIRALEEECQKHISYFTENQNQLKEKVKAILETIGE